VIGPSVLAPGVLVHGKKQEEQSEPFRHENMCLQRNHKSEMDNSQNESLPFSAKE